jgi:sialate O-acetylesterase
VPVGVIECAWGGKPVQAFTSEEALGELPAGKKLLEMKAKALAGYDSKKVDENFKKQVKAYKQKLAQWERTRRVVSHVAHARWVIQVRIPRCHRPSIME